MDNTELKLIEKSHALYFLACRTHGIEPQELIFDFTLKGLTAGQAWYNQNRLRYNYEIAQNNLTEFLNDTVPHEVCHMVARMINKYDKPHGKTWKRLMMELGYTPSRCHNFASEKSRQTKKYIYQCVNCGKTFNIGSNKHGKIQSKTNNYCCGVCKKGIYYTGQTIMQ